MKEKFAVIKLRNRRVKMCRIKDGPCAGDYGLLFVTLDADADKRNRRRVTQLALSPEAMDALVMLYFAERGAL